MITDVKKNVLAVLKGNDELVSLLGGERIYQLVAPHAEEYPRITFFEVANTDKEFADDRPYASEIVMQIDIWSNGSTSDISGQVDRTMKEQGWNRTLAVDQYEKEVQVYHKALRYRTILLEENE